MVFSVAAVAYCLSDDVDHTEENRNMIVFAGHAYKVDWIGHPVLNDNDRWTPSTYWPASVEIGFCENGAVVWREKK